MKLNIRNGKLEDLERVCEIEKQAFPPAEAALPETYEYRLEHINDWFFVGETEGNVVCAVVGRLTEQDGITDVLYESVPLKEGAYFAILSVLTDPAWRRKGFAGKTLRHALEKAREAGLTGVTLACKDFLVSYYETFGFSKVGVSDSVHGGAVWNDMRLLFSEEDADGR